MIKAERSQLPASRIIGTGMAVPETVVTNQDMERIVETSDEWISTRSGVKERRWIKRGEKTSDYATLAAQRALEDAGVSASDLDFIILGTISPDMRFPATAIFVQDAIKATNAVAWDVSATCSGFLYCLYCADALIASGRAKCGLIIGVEILSLITDFTDRGTCVLFGDGAGAAVLTTATDDRGILASYIGSNGEMWPLLYGVGHGTAGQVSTGKWVATEAFVRMNGNEVFKHAVRTMERSAVETLRRAGITPEELDWLVPHQANTRIIEATATRLKLPPERVFVNINRYGNTSAASIPIALDEGRRAGLIKPGQKVLCVAFGGGFTWGGAAIKF